MPSSGDRREMRELGVVHQGDQLVLRAHVVVERHRARAELGGDAPHRDRLEALLVGEPSP